jgi:hypothetical protein
MKPNEVISHRGYVTALRRQSTVKNHFGMGMINKMSTKAFPSKDDIHRFHADKLAKEATKMVKQVV